MSETEFEYKTTNDEFLRTHYDFIWIKDASLDFLKTVDNTNVEWFPPSIPSPIIRGLVQVAFDE